jgi:hypothetical protein
VGQFKEYLARLSLFTGFAALAAATLLAAGCGGGGGGSSEDEVKDATAGFLGALIDGRNEQACASTTDPEECLGSLVLAQAFLGEGGYEALLGEDWRENLEAAEVTFADENHASVPPLTPDEGPTELAQEDGEWLIVVEEDQQAEEFTEQARDFRAAIQREAGGPPNRSDIVAALGADNMHYWDMLIETLTTDNRITSGEYSQAAEAVAWLKAWLEQQ